jgi:hypothetical protein
VVTIRYFAPDGSYRELALDAALSQSHALAVEVTKFPVEDGTVVSDHAILQPDSYRVEGIVTNTPVVTADEMAGNDRRAESARALLEIIVRTREPVTIDTGGKVLELMVLSALDFPRDAALGDATRFTLSATQIVTVQGETVAIPRSPKPALKKGGKQPTSIAPAPVQKRVSVLKLLANALRGGP